MKLSDLQEQGGFVDATPVQKEVVWKGRDGKEKKGRVYVVPQPFGVHERILSGLADGDKSAPAQLIARSIRLGDDASEQLTYEQAYQLHPKLAWAMISAINEVNNPNS